jgi:hypothetical protein
MTRGFDSRFPMPDSRLSSWKDRDYSIPDSRFPITG